jgi:hypothetical protein
MIAGVVIASASWLFVSGQVLAWLAARTPDFETASGEVLLRR